MLTAAWPAAISAATGLSESWVRQVLRVLREAEMIPNGRYRLGFSSKDIARVVLGLGAPGRDVVPAHVRALEMLPNRIFPPPFATAGEAITKLVDDLISGEIRPLGILETNRTWQGVTVHAIDDTEPQRFGTGDHGVHQNVAQVVTMPLHSVLGIARVLTS